MTMKVELIYGGRSLPAHLHDGQTFIEAPAQGAYDLRLSNNSGSRQLAIVSVDGVNVVDGTNAGYDGPGYVLRPWETVNIPGWRRSDTTMAKFTFQPQEGSYAARTGRGTKNNGVIGVAVFHEKVVPLVHHLPYGSVPGWFATGPVPTTIFSSNAGSRGLEGEPPMEEIGETMTMGAMPASAEATTSSSTNPGEPKRYPGFGSARVLPRPDDDRVSDESPRFAGLGATGLRGGEEPRRTKAGPKSRGAAKGGVVRSAAPVDLGTGYGKEVTMYTETTTFERASTSPVEVIVLRYAVRARLIEWGVPVEIQDGPQAFPASASPSVAAPPGWRASR